MICLQQFKNSDYGCRFRGQKVLARIGFERENRIAKSRRERLSQLALPRHRLHRRRGLRRRMRLIVLRRYFFLDFLAGCSYGLWYWVETCQEVEEEVTAQHDKPHAAA